jgi:hypothetical protein
MNNTSVFSRFNVITAIAIWMMLWLAIGLSVTASAQPAELSPSEQYIEQWADEAVYQMALHGIPASITLSQGILESGNGNSQLAIKSNNHFGIKCHGKWTGEKVYHDDDAKNECFRAYQNAAESFQDHSEFLKKSRYESLFVLKPTDYKGWAKGLKKCGYATNPKYASKLVGLIERYNLERYDEKGLTLAADRAAFAEAKSGTDRLQRNTKRDVNARAKKYNRSGEVLSGIRSVQVSENEIRYTLANGDESYELLAKELDMMTWQLYRYNGVKRTARSAPYRPEAGETVYLQPKRTRGQADWLSLRQGESIWQASQRSGVSVRSLVRKNRLTEENPLPESGKLSLRWRLTPEGKMPRWLRTIRGPSR